MSAFDPNENRRKLYLDYIEINGIKKWKFRVKLRVKDGNDDEGIDLTEHAHRWTPSRLCEVPATGSISVTLKAGVAVGSFGLGKQETTKDISCHRISEEFLEFNGGSIGQGTSNASTAYFSMSEKVPFDDNSAMMTLIFRPSQASETTRQALHRVKVTIEDYSQLKARKIMRSVDTALKLGLAASEANPYAKAAFSVARATYDLLSEQQKYDEQVSDLVHRIEKLLPFFEKAEALSYDDADLIKTVIVQMDDLVVNTANFAYNYVHQSFMKRFAKSAISPTDRKRADELQAELDNLTGELDRAIEVETLKATKDIDAKLLLKRLKPVDAGYNCKRKCMEGTRQRLINKIVTWAVESTGAAPLRKKSATRNVLWLYGMPGIGKTTVAHSICARLHAEKRLGGSFFCRRDDPKLGNSQYVLPTLTCRLAEMWGPFRKLVAEELNKDPQITPESTGGDLLMRLLKSLKYHPPHPLVLVIDALDECGDNRAREVILRRAFDATSCVLWLKVIITSRQEGDINEFFQQPDRYGRYLLEDLSTDDKAHEDIRYFTKKRLSSIVAAKYLKDWAPEHLVNKVVMRASGLYIYVDTLWRLVRDDPDPEIYLNQALDGSSGDALGDLYHLYSGILNSRVKRDKVGFRAVMGAILVVGSYRPLCAETIAILVGRQASVVQTLVDNMSSLLYRDNQQNGGIRFRHLSIIDFLTSASCPEEFQVDLEQAHRDMAVACLNTMIGGLKFNICKLKSSHSSNEEVEDMEDRIKENISDELQYSCMHWSSHLSFSPYSAGSDTIGKLYRFFDDVRPLYWVEVLSLMGRAPIGIGMLREVIRWVKRGESSALEYVDDMCRFLLAFIKPIIKSTPHIYISALPFTPVESILWKKSSRWFQGLIRVEKGRMERWPARSSTWTGHTRDVLCLAYSPDGLRVVSGSCDYTIRMWDVESGAPVGDPLTGHAGSVRSIAYSPDGLHIVSGSDDKTIRIWDAETGAPVGEPLTGHSHDVSSISYSPDGRHIVSGSWDKTIRIWDAETGAPVGEPLRGHTHNVSSVSYFPDGRHILSSSWDKTLQMWDVQTGAPVGEPLKGHTRQVTSASYSPDGLHIVSSSLDNTIRIWNAESGDPVGDPLKVHTGDTNRVSYSPDGRHIISGGVGPTIRVWDAKTGAPAGEPLKGHTDCILDVTYSPDGRHIVSASADKAIRIWDAKTGAPVGEPSKVLTDWMYSVAYSPDGRYIASGSNDSLIRIWDAKTGALVGEPLEGHAGEVFCVVYSPDGRHLVSSSWDQTIRIWDAATGASVGNPLKGHSAQVLRVVYSPDGRHIASCSSDMTVRIWDVQTGAPVCEPLMGHTGIVRSVAYSPDGRRIVSSSFDRTIRVWDTETGAPLGKPLEGHTSDIPSVAYSPDGRHIVSCSFDRTIRIWDARSGASVGEPLKGHADIVNSVSYSPDGQHIISCSDDRTIRIWDTKNGAPVGCPLKGHIGRVISASFSPDGRHVVSTSLDKTIRIWDTDTVISLGDQFKGHLSAAMTAMSSPGGPDVSYTDTMNQIWNSDVSRGAVPSDLHLDQNGWVNQVNGGLLFWVPENCRNGLTCPAILTIPTGGFGDVVRLSPSDACFGASWEQIATNG